MGIAPEPSKRQIGFAGTAARPGIGNGELGKGRVILCCCPARFAISPEVGKKGLDESTLGLRLVKNPPSVPKLQGCQNRLVLALNQVRLELDVENRLKEGTADK